MHYHRLASSGIFLFQCGNPTGTGSGGPGYTFADELDGSCCCALRRVRIAVSEQFVMQRG